jgi:asparagine synthase (glutamine-hydrolysing)
MRPRPGPAHRMHGIQVPSPRQGRFPHPPTDASLGSNMCGIAGIVSADSRMREQIGTMVQVLGHRGPDDRGIIHLGRAALGHQRLSIIDIDGGHQPLANAAGTLHIVFNGEIYNYRELRAELQRDGFSFQTRTDTEVVLALFERDGPRCVERLRGMFAFGIWNAGAGRLFLARDRMGQKPLFYRRLPDGGLAFASEVKALLAAGFAPAAPDLQALAHYISLRFVPDDRSLFSGITKLPAAHTLIFDGGELQRKRYWSLSYLEKVEDDEEAVTEELDRLLREAVLAHAVADVPVGTFLSGGIDSSIVTAMLSDQSASRIPTFAIGVKEQGFSELPFARRVAECWNTDHHEEITSADLVRLVPQMIWHMDEPSDPYGAGCYLVSRLASRHVKVVLSGDGGDELFAGYDRFAGNKLVDFYGLIPAPLRRTVLSAIADRVPDNFGYKSVAQRIRWANAMSLRSGGERYALSMSFLRFTEEDKQALLRPEVRNALAEPESVSKILEHYEADCVSDVVDRMLHTDCMTRLPDHLLVIADRMSMAHGLEVRPPFVDHQVMEFAARLPARLKLNGSRLKYILRRTASRYLPEDIITRPKQGFGFPLARWMRTDLQPVLRGVFAESRMVEAGVFDGGYMGRLLEEHVAGRRDHNFRLWVLLNVELWYRMYMEGASREQVTEWLTELSGRRSAPAVFPESIAAPDHVIA